MRQIETIAPDLSRIAESGRNCWCRAKADKLAFLIDGAAYFAALREALESARHSILILGWDIDSRVRLAPGSDDEACLGPLLDRLVGRRHGPTAHVLIWDFSVLYALEREFLPMVKLDWQTHPRLKFRLDDDHPPGASHHQKVVVIDDRVAFIGGLDITSNRWDTPAHAALEPRRINPRGQCYGPFHDVQVAISGEAAARLGELARERWRRATGKRLRPPPPMPDHPWPPSLAADATGVTVALARTEPAWEGRPEVKEVKALHLDSIAAARHAIYIECQFATADCIAQALSARLSEPDGPEVVLVLPRDSQSWLERNVMKPAQTRLLNRLRQADRSGRLRIFHPRVSAGERTAWVQVHAKVTIVDSCFARIGSANLNNRSMGLDTECDLALEADGDPAIAATIAGLRDRLLAEHLGTEPDIVAEAVARLGLVGAIDSLNEGPRALEPFAEGPVDILEGLFPSTPLLDPEAPIDPESVTESLLDDREDAGYPPHHPTRRMLLALAILLAAAGLAAGWRWSPLRDLTDLRSIVEWSSWLRDTAWSPAVLALAYVLGGFVMFPVLVLVAATAILFGPVSGFLQAQFAALVSASVFYAIGRGIGRKILRRLAGRRLNRISRQLGRRGIVAMATLRILPIAPFTLINLVAGASHIRFRDFCIGTMLGLTPGILALSLLGERLTRAVRSPELGTIGALAALLVLAAAVGLWLRRRLTAVPTEPMHD